MGLESAGPLAGAARVALRLAAQEAHLAPPEGAGVFLLCVGEKRILANKKFPE